MENDRVIVSCGGLARLNEAVSECARQDLARMTQAVIEDMKRSPALDSFGDLAARHLWDEYCWSLQEGPFDSHMVWDGVRLGALSSSYRGFAWALAMSEAESLPRHRQIVMSVLAHDLESDLFDGAETAMVGEIWLDGIARMITDAVDDAASHRCLDLIGPDRAACIAFHASGVGVVWDLLADRGEVWGIVTDHLPDLIDPEGDLEPLVKALLNGFMAAAKEDVGLSMLRSFFDTCDGEIRTLLRATDVLPLARSLQGQVLRNLD